MAVFTFSSAESLGNEGVESDEQAAAKERENIKDIRADTDGTNGSGAIGKVADHDGIDDSHDHPAKFGENQWQSEMDSRAEFGAKSLDLDHVRDVRTSVNVESKVRKLSAGRVERWGKE